jgi:hypothetical protein
VGFVQYRRKVLKLPDRERTERRFVDVTPLNNDWGAAYAEQQAAMVAARRQAKLALLGPRAKFEMRLGRSSGAGKLPQTLQPPANPQL